MVSATSVEAFLSAKRIAVVGVSRSGRGFGNIALKELAAHGYDVLPVHPQVSELQGRPCFRTISDLPADTQALLIMLPPAESAAVLRDAAVKGIRHVWLQQGASSPETDALSRELGLDAISGECILMYAAPHGFPHNVHRWVWNIFGKLPS